MTLWSECINLETVNFTSPINDGFVCACKKTKFFNYCIGNAAHESPGVLHNSPTGMNVATFEFRQQDINTLTHFSEVISN